MSRLSYQSDVTIEDVAKAARVSVSTVSRILNNKPDVAKMTRERVLRVIEDMGYTPHAQARSLAGGKSHSIALLFPAEYTGFTQLELDFFIGAATATGQQGFFFNLMTDPMNEQALLNLYRSGQVEGVILMQIHMDDWRVNLLRGRYPFVMIGRSADTQGLSFIDLDFETAIQQAFSHLIDLGHRRIGFITRPKTMRRQKLGPAVRSFEGYQKTIRAFSLEPHYREVDLTVQDVYKATRELLKETPGLSAIVTVNGATSAGIYQALREEGLEIPEDVSVVAVATPKIAQLVSPNLSSINFPSDTIGYQAAGMLIRQLRGSNSPEQILLAPELIIRESTKTLAEARCVLCKGGDG